MSERDDPTVRSQAKRRRRTKRHREKILAYLPDFCEVCGATENLHVDHNHDTGLVRGRLCSRCNNGLKYFGDDLELMAKAIDYLRSEIPISIPYHPKGRC